MNPIGVHFLPTHTGQHHYQFIRDMRPGILKLVGSSTPDVQQIADGYAAATDALIYLRNVARSEQHDFLWRDPVGAAVQHVKEWDADIKERYAQARERSLSLPPIKQIRILGVNEPVIELFPRKEDMSNYGEWLAMVSGRSAMLDSYMVEFGLQANRLGYGTGLGNISSGQPANKKPGEYATFDWFPKTRKLLEATRGINAYTSHEYWRAETGPEGQADWHAWRFTHLEVDCDIDILESGVDQRVTSEPDNGNRGWVGHMDAAAYANQHRRYIQRARQDSRFRCETPFTLDGDKIWESFWIEYCTAEMIGLSNEVQATSTTPPHTTHLPAIEVGDGPTPPAKTTPAYVSATAGANLRGAPVATLDGYNVLAKVPFGDAVEVYGSSVGSDGSYWSRVLYGEIEGWIRGDLLSSTPPVPTTTPAFEDNWARCLAYVLRWEGGFANDANDVGGPTNKGITLSTYTRWRAEHGQPQPTVEELRAITDQEVERIYYDWYWLKSGSHELAWPLCLCHFDLAVNAGVGKALEILRKSNENFLAYMGHEIAWFAGLGGFEHFGRAWTRRRAEILIEASK